MPLFDMPLAELKTYLPERGEPVDFDTFWQQTLAQARSFPLDATFTPVDYGLRTMESFDVTFSGYGGQPIKGWLNLPRQRSGPLPCVVEFLGYNNGRGFPDSRLTYSSCGYAYLIMDSRGQGSYGQPGDTPDLEIDGGNAQYPGFMTRGILKPQTHYFRRLFTDGVRAIEAARSHPDIDPTRIAVTGGSQGGGISLAVAGLEPAVEIAMPDVPFLCHYRRATELVDTSPYNEISRYCQTHRDQVETVFQTLAYFDGVNFAARAKAEALFSVGLMDNICPPSTVFAAYNHYAGPKQIEVWSYNNHEGGDTFQTTKRIQFLHQHWQ